MNKSSRVFVIPCCFAQDGLLNTGPYSCTISLSRIYVANISLFIYSREHEVSYLKSKAPYWCNVELWWWYSNIYDITQSCYCLEPPVAFPPGSITVTRAKTWDVWRWEGGSCFFALFQWELSVFDHMLRFILRNQHQFHNPSSPMLYDKERLHLIWKSIALFSSLFFVWCILSISNLQISLFCFVFSFYAVYMTSLLSCAWLTFKTTL